MRWHPLCRDFEPITGERWARFLAGIKTTKGVHTVPVLYRVLPSGEEEGLSGRQRYTGCRQLGLPCKRKRVRVKDEDVAEFILIHEINRRQLSPEQEATFIAQFRAQGMSQREIADRLKTSPATVNRRLATVSGETPARIQGRDGKSHPATKSVPTVVAKYDPKRLLSGCDALLAEIDRCATHHGLEDDDDQAGELRGLVVQARVRLERWAESLGE